MRSRVLYGAASLAWTALVIFILSPGGPAGIEWGFLRGDRPEGGEALLPPLILGLDRDGDERVSRDEFHVFERLDLDGDHFLDSEEARAGNEVSRGEPARGGSQGAELIRPLPAHDRDGDMRVSPSEFPGPRHLFDRLDRDGDGFLDLGGGAPGSALPSKWLGTKDRSRRRRMEDPLEFVPKSDKRVGETPQSR